MCRLRIWRNWRRSFCLISRIEEWTSTIRRIRGEERISVDFTNALDGVWVWSIVFMALNGEACGNNTL
jgi:hypothetical protein